MAYRAARVHVGASHSSLYAIQGRASFKSGMSSPVFSYTHDPDHPDVVSPPPLVAHQGDVFSTRFHNHIPSPSTIHWHGVRVPFAMDGVPF